MQGESSEKSLLAKWRQRKKSFPEKNAMVSVSEDQKHPVSKAQERLWVLERLYPNQGLYTYAHRYDLSGEVDEEKLVQAFQNVIDRHQILRSTYYEENGKVFQEVRDDLKLTPKFFNSKGGFSDESLINELIAVPFDLESQLPIRLNFLQAENVLIIILVFHHIAGDAWSMNLLNDEVSAFYNNSEGRLPPLKFQFKDFAHWDKSKMRNEKHVKYWKELLSGDLPHIDLPMPSQERYKFEGKRYERILGSESSKKVLQAASKNGVTPFAYLMTAFKVLIGRYTREFDQIIGTPINTRDHSDLEKNIGFFNETYVLRKKLDGHQTFAEALIDTNTSVIDALSHLETTFEEIVREINPDRPPGENPLFQCMFLYNEGQMPLKLNGVLSHEQPIDTNISKFDLTLFVNKEGGLLKLVFEHSTKFDDNFISILCSHFIHLLEDVSEHPTKEISSISILSDEEIEEQIHSFNDTNWEIPVVANIQQYFERQVAKSPKKIALQTENDEITYDQLNSWAEAIANDLRSRGVSQGDFVGLYSKREMQMIAGILGILKAGAAYLPLDPDYPKDRIDYMLHDSKCNLVLVSTDLPYTPGFEAHELPIVSRGIGCSYSKAEVISLELLNSPAYVIYTSGSTGKPKGVRVDHEQLIYSTAARFKFYPDPIDSFLLLSSFSFDSSIAGIFGTICSGGTLVLPQERIEQDVKSLTDVIQKKSVTHTLVLPSLYQLILEYGSGDRLSSLKAVIVAGEACSLNMIKNHYSKLPATKLYNEYGPTESTVWCVAEELKPTNGKKVAIGKPIPNYQAYIADEFLNLMPKGLPGELVIGGKGVTNGYLNNAELSDKKFLPNPFSREGRVYKTGDLCQFRQNGTIDFIGRTDNQAKIRGYRVEPDEIRNAILEVTGVSEAVVSISDKQGSKNLLAYVKASSQKAEEVRQTLKGQLPKHMMPKIISVDDFPRLPNGKIDIRLLPSLDDALNTEKYVAPRTQLELDLVNIWQETLNVRKIGIADNYFDLGGDSILSIQIMAKAREKNITLEPTSLLIHQTIEELALVAFNGKDDWSAVIPMKTSGSEPPLFCIHSGGAHVMFFREFAQEIGDEHPVYAIQPKGLEEKDNFHKSIAEMAKSYISAIRMVQPKGPYHLLGSCFSNAVGIEMVHQLMNQGQEIARLYIIDSAPAFLIPPSPNGERMPVRRMLKMIQKGEWTSILKKFRNRYIRISRRLTRTTEIEKDLDEMIGSLNDLYARYKWQPVDCKVELIRSSEFASRKAKQFHLDRWKVLSADQLNVHQIDGHHLTLFRQPEVKRLAKKVSEIKCSLVDQKSA